MQKLLQISTWKYIMQHYGCGHEIWENGTILGVDVTFNWNLMTLSLSRILLNFKGLTNVTTNEPLQGNHLSNNNFVYIITLIHGRRNMWRNKIFTALKSKHFCMIVSYSVVSNDKG